MATSLAVVARYGDVTLVVRAVLVIAWQVVGWGIVVACFRKKPAAAGQPARAPGVAADGVVPWS